MAPLHSHVPEEALLSERSTAEELTEAARLVDIRSPLDEYRALVEARLETLLKLGADRGAASKGAGSRGDIYREALELGLREIAKALRPHGEARPS